MNRTGPDLQLAQAAEWRKTVGAMARTLDHCAANAPDETHRATMREVSAKLNALLVTQEQTNFSGPLPEGVVLSLFVELSASRIKASGPAEMFLAIVRAVEKAHGIAAPASEASPAA